jgi:Polyketide cyclase / dehydrase and lipid transport
MARSVSSNRVIPLAPEAALALWSDPKRWPSFVEGFARVVEQSGDWPHEGAKIVWESIPEGRGRVTERVVETGPAVFATEVFDKSITGRQRLRVREDAEGSGVELELEYSLARGGRLSGLMDLFFIRRAQRDWLGRTLRRFAVEAEEEAGLR